MSKLLDNKIYKICSSIIEWIVIALLVVLIILLGVQKFSNQGNVFGYRVYTIITGSMIPTYDVGDTLLIKEMSADKIEKGDAVTYLGTDGDFNGKIITHQVVDIETDENGKLLFHTKGVANNVEDPIVSEDQVLGKVVHRFFFLTLLGRITTNMVSLLIFIVIPIAVIIAIELVKLFYRTDDDGDDDEDKDEDEEKEEKKIKEEPKKIIKEENKDFVVTPVQEKTFVLLDEEKEEKQKIELFEEKVQTEKINIIKEQKVEIDRVNNVNKNIKPVDNNRTGQDNKANQSNKINQNSKANQNNKNNKSYNRSKNYYRNNNRNRNYQNKNNNKNGNVTKNK